MEPITAATGILLAVFQNKQVQAFSKDAAGRFRTWAVDFFGRHAPALKEKLEAEPERPETESLTRDTLAELVRKEELRTALEEQIRVLQPTEPAFRFQTENIQIHTSGTTGGDTKIFGKVDVGGDANFS